MQAKAGSVQFEFATTLKSVLPNFFATPFFHNFHTEIAIFASNLNLAPTLNFASNLARILHFSNEANPV